jgi:hypothetical protein
MYPWSHLIILIILISLDFLGEVNPRQLRSSGGKYRANANPKAPIPQENEEP